MKIKSIDNIRTWKSHLFVLGVLLGFFTLGTTNLWAQENKKLEKTAAKDQIKAQQANKKGEFNQAEANYRKSISRSPENMDSRYNLGTSYYDKEQYKESLMRFEEATRLAEGEGAKHSAYHNLGNAFMKDKQYRQAEQAFKEALRNNPTDEETRYNYAIAKELAKDEPEPPSQDDQTPEEQEQNEDQGGEDQDNPEESEGDQEQENSQEQEKEKDPEDKDAQGEKDKKEVPQDGKLSPEQIENLLDAMNNAEKDLQKKLEDQKNKGKELKKEKYW